MHEPNPLEYHVKVQVHPEELRLTHVDLHGYIQEKKLRLEEKCVYEGLIKLGWKPPDMAVQHKFIFEIKKHFILKYGVHIDKEDIDLINLMLTRKLE